MNEEHRGYFRMLKYLKEIIKPYKTNHKKVLIGGNCDGAYVIADIKHDICYSYGCNDAINFETGLYEKYQTNSFTYDHTTEQITNKPDYITFKKEGVDYVNSSHLKTIDYHIQENGHINNKDILLKMDIEGCEWNILLSPHTNLNNFSQIVIEIHMPCLDFRYYQEIIDAMKNLTRNHKIIHIHPVSWPIIPYIDIEFPKVFELTLLKNELVSDEVDCDTKYPSLLDYDGEHSKFPELKWWK